MPDVHYVKRDFEYVIFENTPENASAISQYVDPSGFFPDFVLIINTTNNSVDETFNTLQEAYDKYREVGS